MNKFYASIVAIMMTAMSFAQSPIARTGMQTARTGLSAIAKHSNTDVMRTPLTGISLTTTSMKKAPAIANDKEYVNDPIITDTPDGTLYADQYCTGKGYYAFWGYVYEDEADGDVAAYVINGEDIYIFQPMCMLYLDSWIKGKIDAEGNVTVDLPQKVYMEEVTDDYGEPTGEIYEYYLWRMVPNESTELYDPDETSQQIHYTLKDGVLTRTDENILMGLCDEDGQWTGYGDYEYTLTTPDALTATPATYNPDEDYMMLYGEEGARNMMKVKVAVDGNDVYLGGLTETDNVTWAKGSVVDGDKVVFSGKSYLGLSADGRYHAYLTPASVSQEYDPDNDYTFDVVNFEDEITFAYDAANKTLVSDGTLSINYGKNISASQQLFVQPAVSPLKEVAAAPIDPDVIDYADYFADYDYGGMAVQIFTEDADGNILNPDNIYYNIFIDGEKVTFTNDLYMYVEEDMTDVPLGFVDGWDFNDNNGSSNIRIIYFYQQPQSTVGVQSLYKDGNNVYKSNIVTYDIASGTGINGTAVYGKEAATVTYYDMLGRKTNAPTHGVYVKKVTYSDGSTTTSKAVMR